MVGMDFVVRCWGTLPGLEIKPAAPRAAFVNRDEAIRYAQSQSQGSLLVWEVFQESNRTILECFRHGQRCDCNGRIYS